MSNITLTIDGQEVACAAGTTILDAATAAGIDIPNLCAHPTLKPFGRCRLCLVEVEGLRGYPSACTTPAGQGMVVKTTSEMLTKLRCNALELVLTEHPTGCLMCGHQTECIDTHGCNARRSGSVTGCRFCPSDGQCELQDMVERFGLEDLSLPVKYRGLTIDRRDPFFDRDYNLCILCARCVRACVERRDSGAIELTYRGSDALVGTAYDRPLLETECQFCGACVDLCPTASLAERVNKWVGVPTAEVETTCPFCSLGCQLTLRTTQGQVVGARPLQGQELCAKGRFAPVETVLPAQRALTPLVRHGAHLVEVDWPTALAAAAAGLSEADRIGVYASQSLFTEDLRAIAMLAAESLGTPHLDSDTVAIDGLLLASDTTLEGLASADVIVTVRTDLRYSHTAAQVAISKAVAGGAKLCCIEPFENDLRRRADVWYWTEVNGEAGVLDLVLRALDGHEVDEDLASIAAALSGAGTKVFVWSSALVQSSNGAAATARLRKLAELTGAKLLPLTDGANGRGVQAAAVAPGPDGLPLHKWFGARPLEAVLAFGRPPVAEKPAGQFLVLFTETLDELAEQADVVLPAAVFSELAGTTIDVFGRTREYAAAVPPAGEARGAAWVCAQLAELLGSSSGPATRRSAVAAGADELPVLVPTNGEGLLLVREYSRFTYLGSTLSRKVPGLLPLARENLLQIHPDDAARLELRDGDGVQCLGQAGGIEAELHVTPLVPRGTLRLVVPPAEELVPGGAPFAAALGPNPGRVTVQRSEPARREVTRAHV